MGPHATAAAVVSVGGILLLVASAIAFRRTRAFVRAALCATGTVADLGCDEYVSPDGDVYYYTVVQFAAATGEPVTVRWPCGTNPPPYKVGQQVAVLYDSRDPHRAMARSFRALWYHVVALLGVGATLAGGGVALLATGG